jgi:hypothetical protein
MGVQGSRLTLYTCGTGSGRYYSIYDGSCTIYAITCKDGWRFIFIPRLDLWSHLSSYPCCLFGHLANSVFFSYSARLPSELRSASEQSSRNPPSTGRYGWFSRYAATLDDAALDGNFSKGEAPRPPPPLPREGRKKSSKQKQLRLEIQMQIASRVDRKNEIWVIQPRPAYSRHRRMQMISFIIIYYYFSFLFYYKLGFEGEKYFISLL